MTTRRLRLVTDSEPVATKDEQALQDWLVALAEERSERVRALAAQIHCSVELAAHLEHLERRLARLENQENTQS